jgi:predicted ATPase
MTTSTALPAAAVCVSWCTATHDPAELFRDCVSAPARVAELSDGELSVSIARTTFLLSEPVPTATVVRAGSDDLTPALARRLAAELLAAADRAELED